MLPIQNRLKNKQDFGEVFSKGQYASQGGLAIKYLKIDSPEIKIGFSVGKNYSKNSVNRNQARRILRESTKPILSEIKPGFWIIIFIQPHLKKVLSPEAGSKLQLLLKKAGLLKT